MLANMRASKVIVLLFGMLICTYPPCKLSAGSASGVKVRGVVSDQSGGFVPEASIILLSGEFVIQTKSDDHGHFEFFDVSPGEFEMEIAAPGFRSESVAGIHVAHEDVGGISITLRVGEGNGACVAEMGETAARAVGPSGGVSYEKQIDDTNLKGIILGFDGMPLPNATFYLSKSGQTQVTTSNGRGEFGFSELRSGKYTLRVSRDGYQGESGSLWIVNRNLTKIVIVLTPANYCH
jgi:hypothetical protein